MFFLVAIFAITGPVQIAIIAAGQAVILAVLAIFGKSLINKQNKNKDHLEEAARQTSTNNGRTLGQYVELINDKVDSLTSNLELLNNKVDYVTDKQEQLDRKGTRGTKRLVDKLSVTNDDIQGRISVHEDDDKVRFDILEQHQKDIKEQLGNPD